MEFKNFNFFLKKYLAFIIFFTISIIFFYEKAYSDPLQVIANLKEVQSNKKVRIDIIVKNNDSSFSDTIESNIRKDISFPSEDLIVFSIEDSEQYYKRDISMLLNKKINKNNININLYIRNKVNNFTYQYLNNGVNYLENNELDRALAHFQPAFLDFDRGERLTQFGVKLKYNYARILCNSCLYLDYTTCDEAKLLFSKLKEDIRNEPDIFREERIDNNLIDQALIDIETYKLKQLYSEFRSKIQKDPKSAKELLKSIIEQYEKEGKILSAASLSKDRLHDDMKFIENLAQ